MDNKEGDILKSLNLPRHQSLRLFYISKNRFFFNITVLFKLIERSLKKKKHFDAVLITDTSLFKLLSGLKWVFTTPLVYINPDKMPERSNDDASWRRNADFIVQKIREEIRK